MTLEEFDLFVNEGHPPVWWHMGSWETELFEQIRKREDYVPGGHDDLPGSIGRLGPTWIVKITKAPSSSG